MTRRLSLLSLMDLPAHARKAIRETVLVAVGGISAVRAALYGARLGAGETLSPAVIQRLGVHVIPTTARAVADAIARRTGETAVMLRHGEKVLRAGTNGLIVQASDGIALQVSSRAITATVTHDVVRTIARTSARSALAGVGRAAMQGGAAGAVLEGAFAGIEAFVAVRREEMTLAEAVRHVGKRTARGAVAGAAGVAMAGAISAGVAATGLSVMAAPVVLPVVTMVATSAMAAHLFDRIFGQ